MLAVERIRSFLSFEPSCDFRAAPREGFGFLNWLLLILVYYLSQYTFLSSKLKKMPLDTVLCLDTSGSMGINNNEGINQLKAAASKFLDGVEDTARQAGLQVTSCFLVFK